MGKQDVNRDALGRIEYINGNWARKEYRSLSPEAKRLFDDEVNKIFWLKNPERYDKKLDPSRPEDRRYRDSWINLSYSLIGGTGAQYWENKVKENQALRTDLQRHSEKVLKNIDKAFKEKTPTSTERAAKGILRQELTGEEFLKHIDDSFKEPYAEPVQVAYNIVRFAERRHLNNAARDKDGVKGLFQLYELLISDPDNVKNIQQANRVMAAIGSLSDPSTGLLDKPYIFPAEFTLFDSSHITARLTKDNKIWVKLTEQSIAGHPEALSLAGTEAFTKGITLGPHEWVRFKLYDEGGITVCRPALYLLQLSNKSTKETWSNIINVGLMGLPGGPLFRVGGIIGKGGGRLLVALSKLEKAADIVANGLVLGNIVVRENRGWIIKNYGDKGRKFIEYFDIASTLAAFYGVGKALSTPVMQKSLEHMIKNWDDIKNTGFDPEDASKISEIDKSVNEFKSALKECTEVDDTVKSVDEVTERAIKGEESVAMPKAEQVQLREAAHVLDRTQKLTNVLRSVETDPDFLVWRELRNVSETEFRNWVYSLPEESRADIMERILDNSSVNSLRIKRFVLRDAAHDVRVCKELKKWGIDQVHGDYIGPGHKAKEGIAEILSRQSDKGDEVVGAAVEAHGDGRVHHNPVTADDYLHQALDQYDAVTDELRTKPDYGGYRKDVMKGEDVRKIFVTGEENVLKKRAMEAVLDYKEKGLDPKQLRRDYHDFFNSVKKNREPGGFSDGGGGGKPPKNGPEFSTTELQPLKDIGDSSQTKPPLPYSKVNVRYLGEELADDLNKMGVDEDLLDEYIWRLNWESSKGDATEIFLGRVQERVKKVIAEQTDTSLKLGENLSSKLVKYGYDPSDISSSMKNLSEKGLRPSQVRETLRKETLLMDYLRDQLHGGSQNDAKISLLVSDGDVRAAIRQRLWENMVDEWNNANPNYGPGSERLAQFSEKAKQMEKDIEKTVLGSSLASGAVISQTRKEEKEPHPKDEKEQHVSNDSSEKSKLVIRENKNKLIQKNLKENTLQNNMKSF